MANSVIPRFGRTRLVSTITRADVEAFRASEIGRPARLSRCCKRPWTPAARGWACALCGAAAPKDAKAIATRR
jgi:hypothetical protein